MQLKFLIAAGVIALAVAYLVTMGLQGTTVYFLTVSEIQARGTSASNQMLRVSGILVPGSLAHDASGIGISFLIADPTASTPLTVT
jgi:cytochrome c-type biogenesis protein CcmE